MNLTLAETKGLAVRRRDRAEKMEELGLPVVTIRPMRRLAEITRRQVKVLENEAFLIGEIE